MSPRRLSAAAVAMPILYFATLLVAGIANPVVLIGAVPSMLGTAPALSPQIYNVGMLVTALFGLAGALGIGLQLPKIGPAACSGR